MSEHRFAGKVVVITGGGTGIGRAYGHRFAEEGAAIVVADLDAGAGERMENELVANGHDGLSFPMDVRDTDAAPRMVDAAVERFGGVDILVNNAAIHLDHAQLPFTLDAIPQWRAVFDVNVVGALVCTAACRGAIASRGGGVVVNQSSMAAYGAGGAYSASKLALNSLTVSMANELAADGIRVNGIAPGLVDSESAVAWWSEPSRAQVQERLIAGQMIKRQGTMQDLADMALFLCSDQASFVTGQTVVVDGGHTKKPF